MINGKTLGIVLICLLAINIVYSADDVLIGFQGRVLNITDNSTIETGTLQINISESNDCSGSIYNETFNDPFNSGIFDVMLGDSVSLQLNYNNEYYACTVVNGEQITIDKFRAGTGEINTSDIDIIDFKAIFLAYGQDINLGTYNLEADDVSANQIDANSGLYNTLRIDGLLELASI
jgi:hypothetical protein